jgi:hypothetical protein
LLAHIGAHHANARFSLEIIVESELNASVAVFLVIDAAEHVRSNKVVRVDALALATKFHPPEIQAAELGRFPNGNLPFHPKKASGRFARLLTFQFTEEVRTVYAENSGKNVGRQLDIRYAEWIDTHGFDRKAHREPAAGAVKNGAPWRLHLNALLVLE